MNASINNARGSVDQQNIFLTKDDKIDLVREIKEAKIDSIRWAFIFWIGQVAVMAVLLMYFLKS